MFPTPRIIPTVFLQNINLSYDNEIIFKNLQLTLPAGRCTGILGPSGMGKSSLLKLIAGLISHSSSQEIFSGNIFCDNNIPTAKQVVYMAQSDLLLPWLNAFENTVIGYRLRGSLPKSLIEHAKKLFIHTGLDGAQKKFPFQLSGGMRQRVSLIRTLLEEKPIVLMDEPFSALDTITRFQLQTLTATVLKNRTVLLVTHDPLEALRLADEIYLLSGRPAKLNRIIQLDSRTPRDMNHPEFIKYQAMLFDALTGMHA